MFGRRTLTGKNFLLSWAVVFAQSLTHIVCLRLKRDSNTNLVEENAPLSVDVRG